jgi:N-acetylmuramoyl-L-alanine amidase
MIKKLMTLALAGVISVGVAAPAFAYEAQPGDTMNKISRNNGMTLQELAALNPQISNLDMIYVGQTINTSKNNATSSNTVTTNSSTTTSSNSSVSAYERNLLARLVRSEAQGEPFAGKVAVAEVVLNRVKDSTFPNTITGVITQPGQFSPYANGELKKDTDLESIKAVTEALNGSNYAKGALFFYNPNTATSRWLDSKPTKVVIGNHTFK